MGSGLRQIICAGFVIASCWSASAQPTVSIDDVQVVEGNSGVTNAEFNIVLSAPYSNDLHITFTTFEVPYDYLNEPYPARGNSDFVPTNGYIVFASGETNKSVVVAVLGDTVNEANERFGFGVIGQNFNGGAHAYCRIIDDDPLEITVNDSTVVEGTGGTVYADITAVTHQQTEQTVYGTYTQVSGTATAGEDFSYPSGGRWTLYPGGPTTFSCGTVPIFGDATNEDDEVFFVNVGLGSGRFGVRPLDTNPPNARGVVFLNSKATVTIINDDFYLGVQPLATNRTQLTLCGGSNTTHVVQSSTDLVHWTSLSTNTPGTILVTNNGARFFRALRTVNVTQ